MTRRTLTFRTVFYALLAAASIGTLHARSQVTTTQQTPQAAATAASPQAPAGEGRGARGGGRGRRDVAMDPDRARQLYVSKDPARSMG